MDYIFMILILMDLKIGFIQSRHPKSVRLRLGSKDGFGPERSFDYQTSSFNPIPDFDNKKQFVGINKISKQVSVFSFPTGVENTTKASFQQLDFDLFPEGESDTSWILSDFNKDGKHDILAASSTIPELYFMTQNANNEFYRIQKISIT